MPEARRTRVPTGTDWIHEIKHDGYRLIVYRQKLPLSMRKLNLQRLLARRPEGIFAAPFEQGEIGPDLFRKACEFGLEGLVSKHRERTYRAGRSPNW
jgi:ATP-dependent DNA ligase